MVTLVRGLWMKTLSDQLWRSSRKCSFSLKSKRYMLLHHCNILSLSHYHLASRFLNDVIIISIVILWINSHCFANDSLLCMCSSVCLLVWCMFTCVLVCVGVVGANKACRSGRCRVGVERVSTGCRGQDTNFWSDSHILPPQDQPWLLRD